MSFTCELIDLTESAALIFPCDTCANICGMRYFENTSSIAAFVVPGYPMLCVYFSAIVVRIVYFPLGLFLSAAAAFRICLKGNAPGKLGKLYSCDAIVACLPLTQRSTRNCCAFSLFCENFQML